MLIPASIVKKIEIKKITIQNCIVIFYCETTRFSGTHPQSLIVMVGEVLIIRIRSGNSNYNIAPKIKMPSLSS